MSCNRDHSNAATLDAGIPPAQARAVAAMGAVGAGLRPAPTKPPAPKKFKPGADYYARSVSAVTADSLPALPPAEREMALKLFDVIRADGLDMLGTREFDDPTAAEKAGAGFYAGELAHVAEVVNLSGVIARELGMGATDRKRLTLAATLHDKGKANTAFALHHLTAARGVRGALEKAGLAATPRDLAEIEYAILTHMGFGRENVFMRKSLAGYTAGVAQMTAGAEREAKLSELFDDALLLTPEQAAPVRTFLGSSLTRQMTTQQLSDELFTRFTGPGQPLNYPAPNTRLGQVLADAAALTGEYLEEIEQDASGETVTQKKARFDIEQRRALNSAAFAEALREADASVLTSASVGNVNKYLTITVKMANAEGKTPITHCMASWMGGQGGKGTALDAAESLHLPALREAALADIEIAREAFMDLERETYVHWYDAQSAEIARLRATGDQAQAQVLSDQQVAREGKFAAHWTTAHDHLKRGFELYRQGHDREARAELAQTDLNVLRDDEKLQHEPTYSEVQTLYADYLQANAHRRASVFTPCPPPEAAGVSRTGVTR
jgi:hypothetical protein